MFLFNITKMKTKFDETLNTDEVKKITYTLICCISDTEYSKEYSGEPIYLESELVRLYMKTSILQI